MEIKERNKGKEESKKSKGKVLKVTNESMFKSPTKSKSNIASLLNSSTGDVLTPQARSYRRRSSHQGCSTSST